MRNIFIYPVLLLLFLFSCSDKTVQKQNPPVTQEVREKKKICLNMIVKNESKVIRRCLDCVKPIIDYWVIVDTGSDDDTKNIIKKHMKNIPGELHERPWRNFGENRSEAYELAKGKGDYILFMDADDILEYEKDFKLPPLTHDLYNMWRGTKHFTYIKPQLVRGDLDWKWVGVTHEYLDCGKAYSSAILDRVRYISLDDGATRENAKEKFLRNAKLLEDGLQKEPGNTRYAFYLAESYYDAGLRAKSLTAYQKHTRMKYTFDQEVFWSLLRIAHIKNELGSSVDTVINSYYKAHRFRPHRCEPIYYLAEIYNEQQKYDLAYAILKSRDFIPKPAEKDIVFNLDWIEEWGLLFQLSICSYYLGHFQESLNACDTILKMENLPEGLKELAKTNREFALKKTVPPKALDKNEKLALLTKHYETTAQKQNPENTYQALLMLARAQEDADIDQKTVLQTYEKAEKLCSSKVEGLYQLTKYYQKIQKPKEAYETALKGIKLLPKGEEKSSNWIYDYGMLWDYSIAAWMLGKFPEAIETTNRILNKSEIPEDSKAVLKRNLAYYKAGTLIFDFAKNKWGTPPWERKNSVPFVSKAPKIPTTKKRPKLHICTMATHKNQNLEQLEKSCNFRNIKLHVEGLGGTFSFGKKLRDFKKFLEKIPDDDVVLFLDAYDTLILADEKTIMDKFLSMKSPFVISAEIPCHPFPHLAPYCPPSPTKFKYLNSGTFIGYANYMKYLFEEISPIPDETDDQGLLMVYDLYHPNEFKFDFTCELFIPLRQVEKDELVLDATKKVVHSKTTSTTPCVIHGNSNSKHLYQEVYDTFFKN